MRALPVVAILLMVGLAGCLTDDGDDDDGGGVWYGGPGTLDGLAVMETPLSKFDTLICDGGCLRQMTTLTEGPANEVHVQMDYSDPSFLLAGSKDYHADDPTCVVTSVYWSTDGGRTWGAGYPRDRVGLLLGPSGIGDRCESDPVAAFDGLGNGFMITLDTGIGLFTYKTADKGETWEEVEMAFVGGNDKNWAATDYRLNRVYSITRATCNGGEAITYTDDSAESWEGPFCFNGMDFGEVDVGPEGQVYAIGRLAGEGLSASVLPGSDGAGGITFAKSYDGGMNWTNVTTIASADGLAALPVLSGHLYRSPAIPDMAVSLGTGAIYAVWHDPGGPLDDMDVYFAASFDEGETWTDPVEVPDNEGLSGRSDQFIPAVAASPNGDAHVVWFDARNDPTGEGHLLDVYYAHNPDPMADPSGWDTNIRVTELPFVPYLARHQQQPFFIGDYIGITASNEEAVMVFPLTVNGRSEIHAAIVGGDLVE